MKTIKTDILILKIYNLDDYEYRVKYPFIYMSILGSKFRTGNKLLLSKINSGITESEIIKECVSFFKQKHTLLWFEHQKGSVYYNVHKNKLLQLSKLQ